MASQRGGRGDEIHEKNKKVLINTNDDSNRIKDGPLNENTSVIQSLERLNNGISTMMQNIKLGFKVITEEVKRSLEGKACAEVSRGRMLEIEINTEMERHIPPMERK